MIGTGNGSRFTLGAVTKRSAPGPDRMIVYADPGWGKDTLAAGLPGPIFLNTRGEDRLPKLIEQGLVPETAYFPSTCESWDDLQAALRELLQQPHDYKSLVLNTANGLERLAQELVCATEYDGNWGERGFGRYRAGEKVTADRLWAPLLATLDHLRMRRRMRIVFLAHKGIVTVKNPEGADYDKIGPALSKHVWALTAKWTDLILYGTFEIQVQKDEPKNQLAKNKARGGSVRLLHTSATAAYEAKNVHQLPPTIRIANDPFKAYAAFRAAFPRAKAGSAPASDPGQNSPPSASADGLQPSAPDRSPAAPATEGSLQTLRDWMRRLDFTTADEEEFCQEHHVASVEKASEAQVQNMIAKLAGAFQRLQGQTANAGSREPGDEGPEEP